MMLEALQHPDGLTRCGWAGSTPDYLAYHDTEWGRPVHDDHRLYEKLCLEGFQSGLSWITVLRKRPRFREVFANFDPERVARFGEKDIQRLLLDAGIIRHRGKIEASIGNAQAVLALLETEGSLAEYIWRFQPKPSERPRSITPAVLRTLTTSDQSKALSKDLKKRGFRFVVSPPTKLGPDFTEITGHHGPAGGPLDRSRRAPLVARSRRALALALASPGPG